MGPSLRATMDRGSRVKAKTRPWSIRPFISHRPPERLADQHRGHQQPRKRSGEGLVGGCWGAAIQVIRAITAVEAHHRGSCCSNKLCSMLSAISSRISHINGKWCHGGDYTPVTSHFNMCLRVGGGGGENKSIGFKRATCSVWSNKHVAFFSVYYNKQCERECVGGGQRTSHGLLCSLIEPVWSSFFKTLQTNTISFTKLTHPWTK